MARGGMGPSVLVPLLRQPRLQWGPLAASTSERERERCGKPVAVVAWGHTWESGCLSKQWASHSSCVSWFPGWTGRNNSRHCGVWCEDAYPARQVPDNPEPQLLVLLSHGRRPHASGLGGVPHPGPCSSTVLLPTSSAPGFYSLPFAALHSRGTHGFATSPSRNPRARCSPVLGDAQGGRMVSGQHCS